MDSLKDDYRKIEKTAMRRRKLQGIITYTFLGIWAVFVLFPFYWMILTSLKSYSAYSTEFVPRFFTLEPTIQNYLDAFTTVPLGKYFLNTVIFTVITTGIMLIVIILAAFAFARLEFHGKNMVFLIFLSLSHFQLFLF